MGLRLYLRTQIIWIQRAIVSATHRKFIWLRVGNPQTGLITNLLRSRYQIIRQFIESETESLLVLEQPETWMSHCSPITTYGPREPDVGAVRKSNISSTGNSRPLCEQKARWIGNTNTSTSRVGKGRVGERYLNFLVAHFILEPVG